MKNRLFSCFILLTAPAVLCAQNYTIPSVEVIDVMTHRTVNTTEEFTNNGKPVVISFWATWCKPCIRELSAINEQYATWVEETGVRVIAVSIDDNRNLAKVGPFAMGRGWEFDIYADPNQAFKRAMNVITAPHTFLVNGKGEIVWQHNSYKPGDEIELYNKIKEIAAESASQTKKTPSTD